MDQKNTIVKCKAHPNCLFNYNGVCDNYVINISADGKCECYVETEGKKELSLQYPEYNCDLSCVSACLDSYGELWCSLKMKNPDRPAWCSEYIERTIKE